jgi:hypothetical protein
MLESSALKPILARRRGELAAVSFQQGFDAQVVGNTAIDEMPVLREGG